MRNELPHPLKGVGSRITHKVVVPLVVTIWGCCSSQARGQGQTSGLPATAPASAAASSNQDSHPRNGRRAEVTYDGGLLTVAASNSSLNQILREIARQTGMKITGGTADERVFGSYGPASPSVVLATLLDGTGSNMLMVQDAAQRPTELILTPRIGGATPPNPNAARFDDNDDQSADIPPPTIRPAAPAPPPTNSRAPNRVGTGGIDLNPAATAPSSTSQQLAFPPVDGSTPPATATTTPTTPDPSQEGVRTPQQIFEQLQRLRQQQPQQVQPAQPQ